MSDFEVQLPEALSWRRPPIWWDPVPPWLRLEDDVLRRIVLVELDLQRQVLQLQMDALSKKIDLVTQGIK